MSNITIAMENYLEIIYEFQNDGKRARVSEIAKKKNVSKASVNSAMNVLAEYGLVINEKYHDIVLTPKGEEMAKFICEKHRVIQILFEDVLNIAPKVADEDACLIEHVISDYSVSKIKEFLINNNYMK
ncbi:MAG: metal-dependent transcriptional regulator [Erysipelotrichaceae bacterium]|nr:metal-dependent transcriptional regulator [Erysipelotrichaceae bacterium]